MNWSAVRGAPGGDDYQKIWINPNNPNIILAVADQGARRLGESRRVVEQLVHQPTAAMYHVTTDNAFPYRVCGGQQDSGSACVDSRSMDGEITFHDWHPVNIQEYGVAAPDPKDPDMVFGSARTNVSLYNRKTGQTTNVGPSADQRGGASSVATCGRCRSPGRRSTRTFCSTRRTSCGSRPIARTAGRASAPISRGRRGQVPANAGKYASTVTPAPLGSITALSPSPRDVKRASGPAPTTATSR